MKETQRGYRSSLSYSSDGKYLVSKTNYKDMDDRLLVWDVENGYQLVSDESNKIARRVKLGAVTGTGNVLLIENLFPNKNRNFAIAKMDFFSPKISN